MSIRAQLAERRRLRRTRQEVLAGSRLEGRGRQAHDHEGADRAAVREGVVHPQDERALAADQDAVRLPPDPAARRRSRRPRRRRSRPSRRRSRRSSPTPSATTWSRSGRRTWTKKYDGQDLLRQGLRTARHDDRDHRLGGPRPGAPRSPGARPGGCGGSVRGIASRPLARSSRTPSRRRTRSPTPPSPGDDAKLVDELGDLLFQVYFLALLLEERGAGDLERVAVAVHEKLVRRHPHVFGDAEARTPERVRERWEAIKTEQEGREGVFHDVPESLPALLQARKVQRRAAAVGYDWPDLAGPAREGNARRSRSSRESCPCRNPATRDRARRRVCSPSSGTSSSPSSTSPARRTSTPSWRSAPRQDASSTRVEHAAALAASDGEDWATLELERQDAYYDRAKASSARGSAEERAERQSLVFGSPERRRSRVSDRPRPRPPDPRLARQSDRRGRGRARVGRARYGGRSFRRLDR